jgi:hypothetical protein
MYYTCNIYALTPVLKNPKSEEEKRRPMHMLKDENGGTGMSWVSIKTMYMYEGLQQPHVVHERENKGYYYPY